MKHFLHKSSLALLCFLLLSPWVKGQDENSWLLAYDDQNVQIFINYDRCEKVLLKIINNNVDQKQIVWSEKVKDYQENQEIILNNGAKKELLMEGKSESVGMCSSSSILEINLPSSVSAIGDGVRSLEIYDVTLN